MQFSIVNYSKLIGYPEFRFDADYYRSEYLKEEDLLSKFPQVYIGDIAFITDGQHGYHEVDKTSPISHLTAKNAKGWFANRVGADRLAKWVDENNKRSSLNINDLILSTRGTVGHCAIVKQEVLPANIDQDVARIAINQKSVLAEYILSFLNCKFGQDWLKRNTTGMVQQGLSLQNVKQIPVPVFSLNFQKIIQNYISISYNTISNSKLFFVQSQNILLTELGLNDWQPQHRLTFIKDYSDVVEAERMDAEYFQPQYDGIVNAIKNYSRGYSTIEKEFKQNKDSIKIDNDKHYQYVEIGSVNVSNGEVIASKIKGDDLPANAKRLLKKDDVIISKVRTYRGAITIIEDHGYIGSGAFTVLRENGQVNKETLLAFLHSKPLLAWSLKPNAGTTYPVIVDDDILNMYIPILPTAKQRQIQEKVMESFNLRKQSKQLLENAKRAVEMAIEQDEKTALQWLEESNKDL